LEVNVGDTEETRLVDNDTLRVMRERRSVARFTSDPVTEDQMQAILEAGRWAPSGINSQPWDFVVVRDPELRAELGAILRRTTAAWKGFSDAPAMIVVSVDPSRDSEHFVEDGAVAAQNLCLAACSLGLASSWAGVYTRRAKKGSVESALRKLLSLPRTHRIIAVIPVGVAEKRRAPYHSQRRPLAEMVHWNQYEVPR
jgi:nitroreductase